MIILSANLSGWLLTGFSRNHAVERNGQRRATDGGQASRLSPAKEFARPWLASRPSLENNALRQSVKVSDRRDACPIASFRFRHQTVPAPDKRPVQPAAKRATAGRTRRLSLCGALA